MQGIMLTYHQDKELVSLPMPEHVDELSSLVRIKLQQSFMTTINCAGRVCIQFNFLRLELNSSLTTISGSGVSC